LSIFRCSDGADRLREHWDQNGCSEQNVTKLEQCSNTHESEHIEWRNSMVTNPDTETGNRKTDSDSSITTSIISGIISTILVVILIGLLGAYVYVYGRRNPGGWAERLALRIEAPYNRFLDESPESSGNNNNSVEMGAKITENNNTETANAHSY